MAAHGTKRDKHFPLFIHDNPLRRLFTNPRKFCSYVGRGQIVADLGCGPGYFTLALAESVGAEGRIYAVDSDDKAVQAVESKAAKRGYDNVEGHATSAANLSFIADETVDFVLAHALLCSMAPQDHQSTIEEIRRVLKPNGKAFLSAGTGRGSYADEAEWEEILAGFEVEQRNYEGRFDDRWALVSKKPQ